MTPKSKGLFHLLKDTGRLCSRILCNIHGTSNDYYNRHEGIHAADMVLSRHIEGMVVAFPFILILKSDGTDSLKLPLEFDE